MFHRLINSLMNLKFGQRLLQRFKIRQFRPIIWRILSLLLVVFSLFAFNLHKEYHSLTEIKFIKNEKAVQITMRLFTEDVDLGLKKHFERNFYLGTEKEISDTDKLLELYLNEKFTIIINNQITAYHFLGKEFEKDAMYLFMEINDIEAITSIMVKNSILTSIFSEQENIIKLNINDVNRSLILTKENNKGMLNF